MATPQEISLREAAMHDRAPNLLLLEDDARFAELVRHVLADSAPEYEVDHVSRLSTALARLARQTFSLILTDLDVPDSHGSATVRHLQRAAPNVPLVVLSGDGDIEVALECIREGADEFLVKGTLGFQALGRLLRLALERRQRLMALDKTAHRTTLESIGAHLLRVADRTGLRVSLLLLKVDRPGIGDSPDRTEEITALLRRTLRRCDVVARLQGSEWAVVLLMQQSESRRAATRLTEVLVAAAAGTRIQLGVASYHPEGSETLDDLIAQARRDLHVARV
jgi:DNA-binding NarL/FixJ family response regulator